MLFFVFSEQVIERIIRKAATPTLTLTPVLFLIRDRDIFIGTFRNSNIIYNRIIKAFNKVIA